MRKHGFEDSSNSLVVYAGKGNIEMMQKCLDNGVDINTQNEPIGVPPLSEATSWGNIDSVKFLIKNVLMQK